MECQLLRSPYASVSIGFSTERLAKSNKEKRTPDSERRTPPSRCCVERGREPEVARRSRPLPRSPLPRLALPLAGPAFGKRVKLLARTQNPCLFLGWWVGPDPLPPLLPYSVLAHPSMTFVGVPPGPSPGLPHNMDEGGLASLPLVLGLFPVTCVAPFECRFGAPPRSPMSRQCGRVAGGPGLRP